MKAINEQIELEKMQCIIINELDETKLFAEQVSIDDVENWDITLKIELIYWGQYDIGTTKITREYAKNNWRNILESTTQSGKIDNLYYVGEEIAGKEHVYLYDTKVDIVYKIPATLIGIHKVHSVEELDYQKKYGNGARDANKGTLITSECNMVSANGITHYEPELSGFVLEKTKLIYYSENEDGEILASIEVPAKDYIEGGRNRTIVRDETTYTLYDYKESKWANILVENDSKKTYWVWIPRYAYKINGTEIAVEFIDTNSNAPDGYTLHSDFEDGKKGIWVSKYEPTQVASSSVSEFPYYIPDMTGFDTENTYVEIYNEETEEFEERKLSEIPNLTEFSKQNKWFDYDKQIWANIKVVNPESNLCSWWVWIPRYAYNITGTSTSIIFIDVNNNPLTGEQFPSNYVVHPAFNDGKRGIWVSKYEPSQTVSDNIAKTNNVLAPDLTGFNVDNTYIESYDENTNTFKEFKLRNVLSGDATLNGAILQSGGIDASKITGTWYSYDKKIWANIKVVNENTQSWWVWIPKYAYNITGTETTIIYLDSSGNPTDGSTLPANYVPHPIFNDKNGIWASKYEPINK